VLPLERSLLLEAARLVDGLLRALAADGDARAMMAQDRAKGQQLGAAQPTDATAYTPK
jgi:hypothetical protein